MPYYRDIGVVLTAGMTADEVEAYVSGYARTTPMGRVAQPIDMVAQRSTSRRPSATT